jgi:alpha-beta hydrolase superfamily lysophospholipase
MRRSDLGFALAVLVASTSIAFGTLPVDGVVLSAPLTLPAFAARLPAAARRRFVRLELPVLLIASLGVGLAMSRAFAAMLLAPWPIGEGLLGGGYVFAWIATLRLLRAAVNAGLLRLGLRLNLAALLATTTVLVGGFPLLYTSLQSHRMRVPQRPAATPASLRREEVEFRSDDGLTLRGTLLLQSGRAPAVVVCHGLGANRAAFFEHALLAAELGCHALIFDFRAHGESDGHVTTLGADEVRDVAAAVAMLRRRPEVGDVPVLLLGVSMGGATALRAAATVGAAGVFAESAFADLADMAAGQLVGPESVRRFVVGAIALAARLQPGIDLASVSPFAALSALPDSIGVVLVHAGDDAVIPLAQGQRLATARPDLHLEVFAGVGHAGCLSGDPQRYRRLLGTLLRRAAGR